MKSRANNMMHHVIGSQPIDRSHMDERPEKAIFTIAPVGACCNLACSYCYHADIRHRTRAFDVMSEEILTNVIATTVNSARVVQYTWHGGEPLLAGQDFFSRVAKFQERFASTEGTKVINHIQTNLTLLSKKMAKWLKHYDFQLSTSLDGPREFHDRLRRFPNGRGTFDVVMDKLRLCQDVGLPYGVICVVSQINADYPETVYSFLTEAAPYGFDFSICSDRLGSSTFIPSSRQLLHFFKRAFDLWYGEFDGRIPVRTFVGIIERLLGGSPSDCTFAQHGCGIITGIDRDGTVYPCARFLGVPDFALGKVKSQGIDTILMQPKVVATRKNLSLPSSKCTSCRWFFLCGGGCRFENWFAQSHSNGRNPWCTFRQDLFSHIVRAISSTVEEMVQSIEQEDIPRLKGQDGVEGSHLKNGKRRVRVRLPYKSQALF
ncbi:MAG: radical SAM protein [bacterium]